MHKRRYRGYDYEAVNHPELPRNRMPKPKAAPDPEPMAVKPKVKRPAVKRKATGSGKG